jgi:hypothetical protein
MVEKEPKKCPMCGGELWRIYEDFIVCVKCNHHLNVTITGGGVAWST